MKYPLKTTSEFIKDKNIFLVQLDMSQYLLEYYVHRNDLSDDITRELDEELKDLIACFAIHLTAGIGFDSHAWTVSRVSEHPYSLFVTGAVTSLGSDGISSGYIVGNILTQNIRHTDINALHANTISNGKQSSSYISTEADTVTNIAHAFFQQSEQRPIRIKISENSDTAVGIVALPDFNPAWFEEVDLDSFLIESKNADKTAMRRCEFSFTCNCSPEKLIPFIRSLSKKEITDLYKDDQELLINCPRCGKNFVIKRSQIEKNT